MVADDRHERGQPNTRSLSSLLPGREHRIIEVLPSPLVANRRRLLDEVVFEMTVCWACTAANCGEDGVCRICGSSDVRVFPIKRSVRMVQDEGQKPRRGPMRVDDETLAVLGDVKRALGLRSLAEALRQVVADSELAKRAVKEMRRVQRGLDG